MSKINECGCKGVRTCLLCEETKGTIHLESDNEKDAMIYTYCPSCDLCWPKENSKNSEPLYLGNIRLISDFVSEREELFLKSCIDAIPWMPSQSGRRKQDFGPKANFKKKKVKIGDFKGFPKFTQNIIERLKSVKELTDFVPVELCHLEYTPDRGSAIDPHVDDMWLWGDRLVTINLLSSTVLTLTPTLTSSCHDWPEDMFCNYTKSYAESISKELGNVCNHQSSSISTLFNELKIRKAPQAAPKIKDFCNKFNKEELAESKIAIQITLPPRSLFILSGCARCNWFHEIKRLDVTSRRLAMTFRELSENHLSEKSDNEQLKHDVLEVAKNYCDFSNGNFIQS